MSEKKNKIIVDGFAFENEAEAAQAAKEAEGVRYIRGKTDMDNPGLVQNIYDKMIEQDLFETVVGISYLRELQEYLKSIPFVEHENLAPIPVQHPESEERPKNNKGQEVKQRASAKTGRAVNADYKKRYLVTSTISVVLAVCVVAMFLITATTNNTTILNYETQLINKYAEWEQELTEREQALREQELELEQGAKP